MLIVKRIFHTFVYLLFAYFVYKLLDITLEYKTLATDVGFLRIKQQYLGNKVWLVAFFIHVFTSMFCVIAGFTQFNMWFLAKKKKVHQIIGLVYWVTVLVFSAPSGFIMGIYANGGLVSKTAFIILSIIWFYTTLKAVIAIRNKDFAGHINWMIRSYALTLSAIMLRIYKPSIILLLQYMEVQIYPMSIYRLVSWLGWVPNLIIAEIIIRKGGSKKMIGKLNSFLKN